jgi:tetratricopeptide (TPR) repeat protein
MTALFHTAAQQYGGASVRAPIAAYLTHRVLPLLHTHTRAQIHRDLLSAAAQLTLMLGTMCADSGHDRTAQHYHQVAARLATDAGDSATLAIVLRAMATHAHNLGHHTPAVLNLAEQAVAQARHAPRVVQAYTQAHLGVVLAYHDRHAALTALAHAESLYTQTETAPGPFTAYPPGALYYQRGQTFIILGDPTNTLKSLNTSLRLRAPAECRASVLTRACLAETHLNLGHLDQAIAHWQTFLAAYPTLHSARAARHLRSLKEQLRPHQRYPAARQLLAQAKLLARSVSEST